MWSHPSFHRYSEVNLRNEGDLETATTNENTAKAKYDELMKAKPKEIDGCTAAIEDKMTRVGNLCVEIEAMKGDLSASKDATAPEAQLEADVKQAIAELHSDSQHSSDAGDTEIPGI